MVSQNLELLIKKGEEISKGGLGACTPFPLKIVKVKTKICAIWGILEANLKKFSTPKFMMIFSFVSSIWIHRSIILLIFIEKSMLGFFSWKKFCSTIFYFHFCENPHFREKFQALSPQLFFLNTIIKILCLFRHGSIHPFLSLFRCSITSKKHWVISVSILTPSVLSLFQYWKFNTLYETLSNYSFRTHPPCFHPLCCLW